VRQKRGQGHRQRMREEARNRGQADTGVNNLRLFF
jgi:hypothetical protein